ncbi:MAG: ABC transporter ATP-binding protein [Actinomycetota bacterium]|nr:ABC transporter ATP-binding protein [Actinomycetota bacterium]
MPQRASDTAASQGHTLDVLGLTVRYGGFTALDAVGLSVRAGEVLALLGPSGCGKTTLLRSVAGFVRPAAGQVLIDGAAVDMLPPNRRRVGIVFQNYALFPHMTVADNVAYGPRARGEPRARVSARVAELLEMVQLSPLRDRRPRQLSGGQQQRVALARALATEPSILLLDEPFAALDRSLRLDMQIEVKRLQRSLGLTAILVTHDQDEAMSVADRVAVMRGGRIEQEGTPEEVYGRPESHWVATFLGDAEILPGSAASGRVECELGRFPAARELAGPVDVVVRPESVTLTAGPPPRGERGHEGVVVAREFYGHDQLVQVELASGRRLHSRSIGFPIWHPGDRVRVTVEGPVNALARSGPASALSPSGSLRP